MMKRMIQTTILIILTGLFLSGCTTIPEQLKGEYTSLTPAITTDKDLQTPVRWGGVILETRPENNYTCFEILAKQLEKSMRPENADEAEGRFIACKPGFHDPEVFEKEREVTVVGKIVQTDVRKVGDFDYRFPIVDIEFISLWPKRQPRRYYNYYGPYDSFYWRYPHYGYGTHYNFGHHH